MEEIPVQPDYLSVNLYGNPPQCPDQEMNVLTRYLAHRMHVYKVLGNGRDAKPQLQNNILNKIFLYSNEPLRQEALLADQLSYFLLILAFAKQPQRAVKFLTENELKWFKYRFKQARYSDKMSLYRDYLKVKTLTDEEWEALPADLELERHVPYYKVAFEKAMLLLEKRRGVMYLGQMYLTYDELYYVALQQFTEILNKHLKSAREAPPVSEVVETLFRTVKLKEMIDPLVSAQAPLRYDTIDAEAKNFPLCMKIQHEELRQKHHIKYYSRMEYGRFLMNLGMPLDDFLKLFKEEFEKVMSPRVFQRHHVYRFRHLYGLEGSHMDYAVESCATIANKSMVPEQVFGCPFKTWGPNALRQRLRFEGALSEFAINDIEDLVKKEECGKACALYSNGVINTPVTDPIQYYNKHLEQGNVDRLVELLMQDTLDPMKMFFDILAEFQ